MVLLQRCRTDSTNRVSGNNVFTTVVMPVVCWYTGIQPPSFLFFFFIMPLFLIVLGASGIGAAIALYILRKYDDPNTLWILNSNSSSKLDFLLSLSFNWPQFFGCLLITEETKHSLASQSKSIWSVSKSRYQKTYRGNFFFGNFLYIARWDTFVG